MMKTTHAPLVIGLFALAAALPGDSLLAQYPGDLSGRWTGSWYNSNGNRGPDLLRVRESANGRLVGVWGDGDDLYYIRGQQTGWRRYFWEAWKEGYHYRAWATVGRDGEQMRVRYTVTHFDDGRWQRYGGTSDLWRNSYYGGRYQRDWYDRDPGYNYRDGRRYGY